MKVPQLRIGLTTHNYPKHQKRERKFRKTG